MLWARKLNTCYWCQRFHFGSNNNNWCNWFNYRKLLEQGKPMSHTFEFIFQFYTSIKWFQHRNYCILWDIWYVYNVYTYELYSISFAFNWIWTVSNSKMKCLWYHWLSLCFPKDSDNMQRSIRAIRLRYCFLRLVNIEHQLLAHTHILSSSVCVFFIDFYTFTCGSKSLAHGRHTTSSIHTNLQSFWDMEG